MISVVMNICRLLGEFDLLAKREKVLEDTLDMLLDELALPGLKGIAVEKLREIMTQLMFDN